MKTADLTGVALDWAVAKCENLNTDVVDGTWTLMGAFRPSTDWAHGGPIIERAEIQLTSSPQSEGYWCYACCIGSTEIQTGPTPLLAAMRSYVASKVGEEIKIPKEVL